MMATAAATPLGTRLHGHHAIASARMSAGSPLRHYRIVAMARDGESRDDPAPRPLIVFEETDGVERPVARNDHIVMRADDGGQCDPFDPEDGGGGRIAVRGRYFTVENAESCGSHWTRFVTFRFDDHLGFVFDSDRFQGWTDNPDTRDDAQALVLSDDRIRRGNTRSPIRLSNYRDAAR
jgi:hypothetical protein